MLLSSVAEHLFWMTRYVERAENTARIILVNNNLLLDMPRKLTVGWEPIIAITGNATRFNELYDEVSERNVLRFLVADSNNPNCIVCSLGTARENLRTTRAIVPRAVWETLNDLYAYTRDNRASAITRSGRYGYMRHVIDSTQLFGGKLSGTMSHDEAYEFIRMGRNMERADMTTRVIDVRAGNLLPGRTEDLKPFDDIQWKSVLDSLAAYQVYRRQIHVRVRGAETLRFLLKDPKFPRSVTYCLDEVEHCLRALPGSEAPLRTLGRLQRMVREVDVARVSRSGLNDFINDAQKVHGELNDRIGTTFFNVKLGAAKEERPEQPAAAQIKSTAMRTLVPYATRDASEAAEV